MNKTSLPSNLVIVDHPLVLHKLTLMRDKHTPSAVFRQLLREISLLLAYEVARDLPMTTQTIETPLAEVEAPILKGKKLVIVSILRAGNGLLEGMLDLMTTEDELASVLAVARLKERGAKDIKLVCLLSAPEGVKHVAADHPDVQIFTAAVDSHLNSHGYIVPGLGDAGDRMFGTK